MKEQQLDALLENINYEISLLSNASAFIKQVFSDISWVGFYLCQDNQLILGPFQGKTACTLIPFNKGVCGACATNLKTYCVPDVHQFPSHIACDSATNNCELQKDLKLIKLMQILIKNCLVDPIHNDLT